MNLHRGDECPIRRVVELRRDVTMAMWAYYECGHGWPGAWSPRGAVPTPEPGHPIFVGSR